jgi:hypothetical protein
MGATSCVKFGLTDNVKLLLLQFKISFPLRNAPGDLVAKDPPGVSSSLHAVALFV